MVFRRWFTRAPLHDPAEKAWIELQMHWFSEQFGIDVLQNAGVLLPSREHFPQLSEEARDAAEQCKQRLCEQFQVRPANVVLKIQADSEPPDKLQPFEEENGVAVIRLMESQLPATEDLLSILARGIARQRLIGEGRLPADADERVALAELLPVYFGAGLFGANSTVRDQSTRDGTMEYWSIRRLGSLPSRIFGYALALFAWFRRENKPDWAEYLRKDAREVFDLGIKYLTRTGDSLFHPDTAGRECNPTLDELLSDLRSGTPSRRIAALWRLPEESGSSPAVIDAVISVTRERHPSLRSAALQALGELGGDSTSACDEVLILLRDPEPNVRREAAFALANICEDPEIALPELADLLNDPSFRVVGSSAMAIAGYGRQAFDYSEKLLPPIRRALIHQSPIVRECLHCLAAIHPDPEAFLAGRLDDPELYREANETLAELRTAQTESSADNDL